MFKVVTLSALLVSPICLVGNSPCVVSSTKTQMVYGHIDTEALATLIAANVPMEILDARTGKWDNGKRIGNAKSLSSMSTASEAAKCIPTKETLIVVYCSNIRCPASANLANHLTELGYKNILKYDDGIDEWIRSNHPVEESV